MSSFPSFGAENSSERLRKRKSVRCKAKYYLIQFKIIKISINFFTISNIYHSRKSIVLCYKQQNFLTCQSKALSSIRKYASVYPCTPISQSSKWKVYVECMQCRWNLDTSLPQVFLEVLKFSKWKITRPQPFSGISAFVKQK